MKKIMAIGQIAFLAISVIIICQALALAVPIVLSRAHAQSQTPTPHTVDFTTPLLDVTGIPIKNDLGRSTAETQSDPKCEKCGPVTIGQIVARCLVSDDKIAPEKKPALWALARRIIDDRAASLTVAEAKAITDCADKMSPTVAGQVDPLVDPNFKPQELR